jgi:CubicO group peptidase (beta-lactamase class C family)
VQEENGMDLKEELGRVMRQYVDKNIVAGVNLLVEKDGQEICYCQAGLADRENGKEITRDTIFRLYSQTKPVTAAAAMILMERGKLELCQPVSDFLPSFREQKVLRQYISKTGTGRTVNDGAGSVADDLRSGIPG